MTEVMSLARGARNPFVLDRVDSAWDGSFSDVPSVNAAAFAQCQRTIQTVRESQQSRGLMLTGDPGSGKSHLLHRLRQALASPSKDYFVYVPPVAAAGTLFVELLRRVVHDIIRQPHDGAATQLEQLVVRALLPPQRAVTPVQLWNDMRRRSPPGPTLYARLEKPFEQLVLRSQLDPDVALVLRHYLAEHWRLEAYRWLTACSVPDDVLERLGVTHTLEEDAAARRALFALSKLAGPNSVLVLAFDQLEGMQLRPDDLEGVRMFGNAVADLLIHCRNIAAVSCVQRYFFEDLKHALPRAHMDRIAQDFGGIQSLTYYEAVAVVDTRLLADAHLADARTHLNAGVLWPLSSKDFATVLTPGIDTGLPARTVLNAARVLYDEWQRGSVAAQQPDTAPSIDQLRVHFDSRQNLAESQPPDESTMADGLLKVLDLKHPNKVRRSSIRGVSIEMDEPGGITGICICNTQNMSSLAFRLKQIGDALNTKKIRRAMVVRDARLPISATAVKTQERLRSLQDAGNPLLRPGAAAYAAIAAARQLLAEATAGDLSLNGRNVGADEVRQWLLRDLPAVVSELVNQLDGARSDVSDETVEKLRSTLDGVWIMALEEASARSGMDSQQAMGRLLSGQTMIGVLAGPPTVIFLRPDGLRRI